MTERRVTLERSFRASLADVWSLWTTKAGIESWWGPGGFRVTVHRLDLRPGGELHYTMEAQSPEQIAFMKQSGMPTSTQHFCTYTEVERHRRLAYIHPVDFIPGVETYPVVHLVELSASGGVVQMRLSFDAMHNEEWTRNATAGWTMELTKLAGVLGDDAR